MNEIDKMKRAKNYLELLAVGVDPLTGELMDDNESVLLNDRIRNCFTYVSSVLDRVIANGGEVGRKVASPKAVFSITDEQKNNIEISENSIGATILTKRINEVLDESSKKANAVHITNWLLKEGYLVENVYGKNKIRVASPKGEAIGIKTVERQNQNGIWYKQNLYSPDAQMLIIKNIEEIEKPGE